MKRGLFDTSHVIKKDLQHKIEIFSVLTRRACTNTFICKHIPSVEFGCLNKVSEDGSFCARISKSIGKGVTGESKNNISYIVGNMRNRLKTAIGLTVLCSRPIHTYSSSRCCSNGNR